MKIAVLRAPGIFDIVDEPIPEIGPQELLIRVVACGVCTSELDMWAGNADLSLYPRYPGHEVSGIVEQVGESISSIKPGDRVAVWVLNRGFSEYVRVEEQFCFPAGDLPLELALAEPLGCAVNSVEAADLSLGEDVVIIGAGFMGNLVQILAALRGPHHLIVADTRPDALARALRLGATHVFNPSTGSLPDYVKSITDGRGADTSFEVTGAQQPLELLGEVTRMSGKVVVVGFHQGGLRQINLAYWNWMAFHIINAHFREPATIIRGMRTGMRLLTAGRIHLDGLVSHCFAFEDVNKAFRTACEKPEGFVKSTVVMRNLT